MQVCTCSLVNAMQSNLSSSSVSSAILAQLSKMERSERGFRNAPSLAWKGEAVQARHPIPTPPDTATTPQPQATPPDHPPSPSFKIVGPSARQDQPEESLPS